MPLVCEIDPLVPMELSKIAAKLVLKEPKKRYQTSSGLLADLVRCHDEYTATGTIHPFPLESQIDTWQTTFASVRSVLVEALFGRGGVLIQELPGRTKRAQDD